MRLFFLCAAALVLAGCGERPTAEPAPASDIPSGEADATGVSLDVWLERLEVGSRELYSARMEVMRAVGAGPGDWIADIGAGTGLYTLLFAEAVGEDGRVFAEDIEPLFLELIVQRVADADFKNVTAVLGRETDVTLPAASIDIAFIADTYHYFDNREAVIRSVFAALKPGGKLILIDYNLPADGARDPGKEHVRFGKDAVRAEIEFIGFEFDENAPAPELEKNYFLTFRKPAP